jgi:hypothetical protein
MMEGRCGFRKLLLGRAPVVSRLLVVQAGLTVLVRLRRGGAALGRVQGRSEEGGGVRVGATCSSKGRGMGWRGGGARGGEVGLRLKRSQLAGGVQRGKGGKGGGRGGGMPRPGVVSP